LYVKVPSLTAVHSKVPNLNRYLSVIIVLFILRMISDLILRASSVCVTIEAAHKNRKESFLKDKLKV